MSWLAACVCMRASGVFSKPRPSTSSQVVLSDGDMTAVGWDRTSVGSQQNGREAMKHETQDRAREPKESRKKPNQTRSSNDRKHTGFRGTLRSTLAGQVVMTLNHTEQMFDGVVLRVRRH